MVLNRVQASAARTSVLRGSFAAETPQVLSPIVTMNRRRLLRESLEKQRVGPQVQARKVIFPSQIRSASRFHSLSLLIQFH